MTYLWQEEKGKQYYRFQTDDSLVAEKMRRRKRFVLAGRGINCRFWIYQVTLNRLRDAKKVLGVLSHKEVNYDASNEVYYA